MYLSEGGWSSLEAVKFIAKGALEAHRGVARQAEAPLAIGVAIGLDRIEEARIAVGLLLAE